MLMKGFPSGTVIKNPPAKAGDLGSIPGLGRSPGGGNGNPFYYSCWRIPWVENPDQQQSTVLQGTGYDLVTEQTCMYSYDLSWPQPSVAWSRVSVPGQRLRLAGAVRKLNLSHWSVSDKALALQLCRKSIPTRTESIETSEVFVR